jgi:hypothetical protein
MGIEMDLNTGTKCLGGNIYFKKPMVASYVLKPQHGKQQGKQQHQRESPP